MMIRFWKSLCAAMVVALLIGFMPASLRAANTVDGTTSTAPNANLLYDMEKNIMKQLGLKE